MNNDKSLEQSYRLWALLSLVRDIFFKAREREVRPRGITATQAMVLGVIECVDKEMTTIEISQRIFRERHSTAYLLSRMEKDGLISRGKDSRVKSLAGITLTEKGRQIYYQSVQDMSIHSIMSVLSQEELQLLRSLLEKLRKEGLNQMSGGSLPLHREWGEA